MKPFHYYYIFCLILLFFFNSPFGIESSLLSIFGAEVRITDVILIALWMGTFLKFGKNYSLLNTRLSKIIFIFLLWIFVSCFAVAPYYGTPILRGSLSQLRYFSFYSLFFIFLLTFKREKEIVPFFMVLIIICLFFTINIMVVFFYFRSYEDTVYALIRQNEIFPQILYFFSLAMLPFTKPSQKKYILFMLMVSIFAILVTVSRGVMLTTIIGTIIYFFLTGKKRFFKRTLVYGSGLVIVIGITLLVLPLEISHKLNDKLTRGMGDVELLQYATEQGPYGGGVYHGSTKADNSLMKKYVESLATFQEFKRSPIWGLGIGHEYKRWKGGIVWRNEIYVHSVYSYLLMDTGIVGLGIFLLMLFTMIKKLLFVINNTNNNFYKAVAITGFIIVTMLAINSFNGSYLMTIPAVSFVVTISALCEVVRCKFT